MVNLLERFLVWLLAWARTGGLCEEDARPGWLVCNSFVVPTVRVRKR